VTTVVIGNCGVGVAPVKPAMRDLLLHDLVHVEAIPYEVMHAGIDRRFPQGENDQHFWVFQRSSWVLEDHREIPQQGIAWRG
jgi:hypothetical protein